MQAYQILCGTLLCIALFVTSTQADCNAAEKVLVKGCVNVFVGLNDEAKNLNNTMNCRSTELKDNGCKGWTVFKLCMKVNGGCEDYAGSELKDSKVYCTYKQVSDTCGSVISLAYEELREDHFGNVSSRTRFQSDHRADFRAAFCCINLLTLFAAVFIAMFN